MRKSLLKLTVGVALLLLIGSVFVGQNRTGDMAPREFIVSADKSLTATELHQLLEDLTVDVTPLRTLQGNLHLVVVKAAASDDEIIDVLVRVPGIRSAEPNREYKAQ